MPSTILEDVQQGWKVYAGAEPVGQVIDVGEHEIRVRRGTFLRHEYRVPETYIVEASEGVVDLSLDLARLDEMEETAGG